MNGKELGKDWQLERGGGKGLKISRNPKKSINQIEIQKETEKARKYKSKYKSMNQIGGNIMFNGLFVQLQTKTPVSFPIW